MQWHPAPVSVTVTHRPSWCWRGRGDRDPRALWVGTRTAAAPGQSPVEVPQSTEDRAAPRPSNATCVMRVRRTEAPVWKDPRAPSAAESVTAAQVRGAPSVPGRRHADQELPPVRLQGASARPWEGRSLTVATASAAPEGEVSQRETRSVWFRLHVDSEMSIHPSCVFLLKTKLMDTERDCWLTKTGRGEKRVNCFL